MQPQGEDLKERYDKLSQDYQRIKSQNSILKKAVIQVCYYPIFLKKFLCLFH